MASCYTKLLWQVPYDNHLSSTLLEYVFAYARLSCREDKHCYLQIIQNTLGTHPDLMDFLKKFSAP